MAQARELGRYAVRNWHVPSNEIEGTKLKDNSTPLAKLLSSDIQYGKTSVSFPFAATGEENVSATISFPKAFATAPLVVVAIEGIDVGIVNVSATTTGFTITVRDDKGTDYTTSQTATVHWIAIRV